MILLDISTIQHVLNAHPTVQGNLASTVAAGVSVGISTITETQVRVMLTRQQPAALGLFDQLVQHAPCIPWDSHCAEIYAVIDGKMPAGHGLKPLDLWAGVHAVRLNATLITCNTLFRFVPGLLTKDWT